MRKIEKKLEISIYKWGELEKQDQQLFLRAIKVRLNAQAPYSHYKVGCAILAGPQEIFTGVNVERNSWTQTTHAEQNAIDNAISRMGPSRIHKVAVVGAPEGCEISLVPSDSIIERVDQVCPSCGHCLQIILENCFDENGNYNPNIILMGAHNGEFYKTTIGDALPMPFLPQYLGTNYVKIAEKAENKNRA